MLPDETKPNSIKKVDWLNLVVIISLQQSVPGGDKANNEKSNNPGISSGNRIPYLARFCRSRDLLAAVRAADGSAHGCAHGAADGSAHG